MVRMVSKKPQLAFKESTRRIDSHAFCAVVSLVGFKETTLCDAFKESTKPQLGFKERLASLGFKERARCGFFETKREAKEMGCLNWY